ncbi:acyl-CoA dehydrogenase, partial [Sinorhizobium medicae]
MDFRLSEEQEAIRTMAFDFARDEIAPHAVDWDQQKHFPVETLRAAAALGMAGIYVRDDVGGTGLTRLDAAMIIEALATGCPAIASFVSIHNMSALKTKAVREGEAYLLTGQKQFISGAGVSGLYIVMARTGEEGPKGISAFVVEKDAPGLTFGANEKKMGWHAQPTRAVMLDSVRVPVENRLGAEGEGFRIAMAGLDGGRLNIAAASLGGAQSAFHKALAYVQGRRAFGKAIGEFQALQFRLADMATDLEIARTFLWRAASALDAADPEATKLCAMAKRFVTDRCFAVANDALQLHGGYGYLADYGVEKIV